jgi:hypothetical protein
VLALYYQLGLGHTALESGLAVTSYPVGSAVAASLAGRVVTRVSRPVVVFAAAPARDAHRPQAMRSASARRRRPCSSISRGFIQLDEWLQNHTAALWTLRSRDSQSGTRVPGAGHLRDPQRHPEDDQRGQRTVRLACGPRLRCRGRTSCRDSGGVPYGTPPAATASWANLRADAARLGRHPPRLASRGGGGATCVRPVTSLDGRSGISGPFGSQKDSSHEPACNETCNEICATNRANQSAHGRADCQIPRISWCPRQDSNLRRPA